MISASNRKRSRLSVSSANRSWMSFERDFPTQLFVAGDENLTETSLRQRSEHSKSNRSCDREVGRRAIKRIDHRIRAVETIGGCHVFVPVGV